MSKKKNARNRIIAILLAVVIICCSVNMFSIDTKAATNTLAIEGEKYPIILNKGDNFTWKGVISSQYKITKVIVRIYKSDQTTRVFSVSVVPNAKKYDLNSMTSSQRLKFSKLAVGTYYYRVYAEDASGAYKTLVFRKFYVSVSKEARLNFSTAVIAQDGPQQPHTQYCSVHALAYANSIIDNKYHDYMSYWSSAGAVWSRGGFTAKYYSTKKATLYAAYEQIRAGKPCIIYVTEAGGYEHYVTVFGYINVGNPQEMSVLNLRVIDPVVRGGTQYFGGSKIPNAIKDLRKKSNGYYQLVVKQ